MQHPKVNSVFVKTNCTLIKERQSAFNDSAAMSEMSMASSKAHSQLPRNPRRRQRADVDEGTSPRQQPQRKRSKVAGDSFKATSGGQIVGNERRSRSNGYVEQAPGATVQLHMPVREKSTTTLGKRVLKEDGGVLLVC